jgi:hypothetical protein
MEMESFLFQIMMSPIIAISLTVFGLSKQETMKIPSC